MKHQIRFWASVVLLISGTIVLGYSSGQYHGMKRAQLKAHDFLQEVFRATSLQNHLKQDGQTEWLDRLGTYGLTGPDSYLQSRRSLSGFMLLGLGIAVVGLLVLRSTRETNRPS